MKQRNYSLDLLKFISSFMIVCIHINFQDKIGNFFIVLARFAVPVFFIISGYFSYNNSLIKLKSKAWHIAKLYLFAVVLYFCFNIGFKAFTGDYTGINEYLMSYLDLKNIIRLILFNDSITEVHLWFLPALVYCYVIWCALDKLHINENITTVVSYLLLAFNIVAGTAFIFMGAGVPSFWLRNFLFIGLPFFAFGRFINKYEDFILKKVNAFVIIMMILLSLAQTFVVYENYATKEIYIGSVLMAFALIFIALKIKNKTYSKTMIFAFNTSTIVYIIHLLIVQLLGKTVLANIDLYQTLKPVFVFAVSVIVAMVVNAIKYKINKIPKSVV